MKLPSGQKPRNHVGNGISCQRRVLARRSVEVADSKISFADGNRFQLNDVIEGQQFDRDTLNVVFEVARDMEKVEKTGILSTQVLLDVYTIERKVGKLDGIRVALVGDLANGRTVRSLAYLLAKYQDVKIYFVSPDVVKMKDDVKEYLTMMGVEWKESVDLMEVASKCDVVCQTCIQRERFGQRIDLYEEARGKYIVDIGVLNVIQKHAVVMHPLPRLDEITVDVDSDLRAAYFRQARNGLYIRMALLKLLLDGC